MRLRVRWVGGSGMLALLAWGGGDDFKVEGRLDRGFEDEP